jgi:hypothetical protein
MTGSRRVPLSGLTPFLISWVPGFPHPRCNVDLRFRFAVAFWFLQIGIPIRIAHALPEQFQGLTLAGGVVAEGWVEIAKLPPLGEDLFSADIELRKSLDFVLHRACPYGSSVLLHVCLHLRLALDVRRPAGVNAHNFRRRLIGHRAGEDEVSEGNLLVCDRGLDWSFWHEQLLNTTFIYFYRIQEPLQQLGGRFLAASAPFCPGYIYADRGCSFTLSTLVTYDSKWWPETGSNRRRRPFQGPLPMDLSCLESADPIETKALSTVPI